MGSIYLIRNNVNGKSYVGKTVRDAEKTRIYMHLNGYGGAKLLARAIKKYGKENFSWEIIHDGILPNLLDSLEIETIEKYNTMSPNGYNLTTGGEGAIPSPETRRKISEANKGKKGYWKDKKRSVETKAKMAVSRLHPDRKKAYAYYAALPASLSLKEKRGRMRLEFPNVDRHTIWRWLKEWQPEQLHLADIATADEKHISQQKKTEKIQEAAYYFAFVSKDVTEIAAHFNVSEKTVRRWSETQVWRKALIDCGQTPCNSFRVQPTRQFPREKIREVAYYFATVTRDSAKIAEHFNMRMRTLQVWSKTEHWTQALKDYGYTGVPILEQQPKRDVLRDSGVQYQKAYTAYCDARAAGNPKHKLPRLTEQITGISRDTVRRWAKRFDW